MWTARRARQTPLDLHRTCWKWDKEIISLIRLLLLFVLLFIINKIFRLLHHRVFWHLHHLASQCVAKYKMNVDRKFKRFVYSRLHKVATKWRTFISFIFRYVKTHQDIKANATRLHSLSPSARVSPSFSEHMIIMINSAMILYFHWIGSVVVSLAYPSEIMSVPPCTL